MCRVHYADDDDTALVDHRPATITAWPRRCCDCGRRIEAGEPINRSEWAETEWPEADYGPDRPIPGGRRHVYVSCHQCMAAARWLTDVCDGYLTGGITEELDEHWDEDPLYRTLGLGRLIVAARRGWLTRKPDRAVMQAAHWDLGRVSGDRVPVETVARWVDEALAEHARREAARAAERAA